MDTPIEEQQMFQNVTCNIAASEDEIIEPNTLSVDFINYVRFRLLYLDSLRPVEKLNFFLNRSYREVIFFSLTG